MNSLHKIPRKALIVTFSACALLLLLPAQALTARTSRHAVKAASVSRAEANNASPVLPGAPPLAEANDQRPGSVLFFNYYTSSANPGNQNTRISITNTNATTTAFIHLFFVDGGSGGAKDQFICLTNNQTTSFNMSDSDPGVTGFVLAVAVDAAGCPVSFNYLLGDEAVKLSSGHRASFYAEAIPALFSGTLPGCSSASTAAVLSFDGISYAQLPRTLAVDKLRSPADGNSTMVIVNRVSGNYNTGVPAIGGISGQVFDASGTATSFTATGGAQYVTSSLNSSFAAGAYGWASLSPDSNIGVLGIVINFNTNIATSPAAFTGGRNLHKLTLAAASSITISVTAPSC